MHQLFGPKLALAVAALLPLAVMGGTPVSLPIRSPDIHLEGGDRVIADEQSEVRDLFAMSGLPTSADVDAMHVTANGDTLFSLESGMELDGTLYRPGDLIRYDGSQWSLEFDGRSAGLPAGVNVDACAMSGETLLFSVDVGFELAGAAVSDADILAFDGTELSVFLAASDAGIGTADDVDALHVDDQGLVYVSFEGSGQLGGVEFRDQDVLSWSGTNWALVEANGQAAWSRVDLDAWTIVLLDQQIFFDSFE